MLRHWPVLLTLALFALPVCCDLNYGWWGGCYRQVGFEDGSLALIASNETLQEGWWLLPHGPRLGGLVSGCGPERCIARVPSWLVIAYAWFAFKYLKIWASNGLKMLRNLILKNRRNS